MSTSKQRKLTLKLYGQLYKRIDNAPFDQCWYCGNTRECLDHCPPLALLNDMNLDNFRKDGYKFVLVPSCNDCNLLLGNKRLVTPEERIAWLLNAYIELHHKASFGWTKEETKQMGYKFRVMINNGQKRANAYYGKVRSIERRILDIKEFEDKHGAR